uniref:EGF-like domain-containing protein n=1 Tax=Romanomermis culicivorax TaxID=13658 RepID=A0A915K0L8_ROMCU
MMRFMLIILSFTEFCECHRVANNPCLDSSLNDCDPNAVCSSSSPGQYECTCPSGFVDISPNNRKNGKFCRQCKIRSMEGQTRCYN